MDLLLECCDPEDCIPEGFCRDLVCSICLGIVSDPTSLCANDHLFCRECVEHKANVIHSCPMCHEPVERNRHDPRLLGNQSSLARRLLSSSQCYCPFQCGTKLSLDEVKDHMATCSMRLVRCPYHYTGCTDTMCAKDVDEHIEKHCTHAPIKQIERIRNIIKRSSEQLQDTIQTLEHECKQYLDEAERVRVWKKKVFKKQKLRRHPGQQRVDVVFDDL